MSDSSKPLLSNAWYDVLKHSAILVLPAMGALYFALAQIWHLPKAEEVVGTIAALNVFIGILTRVSTVSYNNSDASYDGTLNVETPPDGSKKTLSLELNDESAAKIQNGEVVTFRVKQAR